MTSTASKLRFEEFERLPDPPDGRYELVRGELVHVPPPKISHSEIQDRLFEWLNARLSREWKRRIEFACRLGDDSYIVADVGVTTAARWNASRRLPYFAGAPELSVEILSPGNSDAEIEGKVRLYLSAGAQECWVVDPAVLQVTVHSLDQPRRAYASGDSVPLTRFGVDEALPVRALFAD